MTPNRKAGRPKGAASNEAPIVETTPSRCPTCGSTRRAAYFPNPVRREITGIDPHTGQVYTAIVWRRTKCEDCGQHRTELQRVNEPDHRAA